MPVLNTHPMLYSLHFSNFQCVQFYTFDRIGRFSQVKWVTGEVGKMRNCGMKKVKGKAVSHSARCIVFET